MSLNPIFNIGPTVESPVTIKLSVTKLLNVPFVLLMSVAAKKGVVTLMSAFKISISPSMEVIKLDTITGE